jgi:hypothetical protein
MLLIRDAVLIMVFPFLPANFSILRQEKMSDRAKADSSV